MAFDFLSYIVQQAEQQHPSIFTDETKLQRHELITHLIALHLAELQDIAEQKPDRLYEVIHEVEDDWLSKKSLKNIQEHDVAHAFFNHQRLKMQSAGLQTAHLLLTELKQLDQNANLEIDGLKELLQGQFLWMQQQVQSWFWDTIDKPEYKVVESEPEPEFDQAQVTKEFNQMIHQQNHEHHEPVVHVAAPNVEPVEASVLFKLINPIVALLIIIFLFKAIF
ncbi:hypothetical protein F4V57_09310 [Acinetobacter qingfengensis]|uniref:Uncharacterized protein n=1 Tax=Acinetobacter qingfengensis TaxID=1262585 RepID=A0A1E7RFI8_9GAMM|nr:hypothetical protein [Acinetobacter qingfengensis]KAA8732751.1 hypothetical protein F4V57_09310 [Acinetobacter qingfengensis]OEY98134.1 hypothetical protein BJI46_01030 [Acinetobacter qingfengensis]